MADGFHDFVKELLAKMPGGVQIKRMFGGAGVYCDKLMFGLIADDTLHLKVDDTLKAELKKAGSGPFVWEPESGPRKGEKVEMGYWRLPEDALDDPDLAVEWGKKAFRVAKAKAATKKPKAAKRAPKKAKPKSLKGKR